MKTTSPRKAKYNLQARMTNFLSIPHPIQDETICHYTKMRMVLCTKIKNKNCEWFLVCLVDVFSP